MRSPEDSAWIRDCWLRFFVIVAALAFVGLVLAS